MFDRVQAKTTARELMRRYLGAAVGADMLSILGAMVPFGAPPAQLGLSSFYLSYADQKRAKASAVFSGYNNALKAVGLFLWRWLWMALWIGVPAFIITLIAVLVAGSGIARMFNPYYAMMSSASASFTIAKILLILAALWAILGTIYKRVQYSFAFFVLAAHPELSVAECLRRSRDMTGDCFWQLLVMRLSFIGWAILSAITSGLVSLFWAAPYFNFTYAVAYRQLDPAVPTADTGRVGGSGGYTQISSSVNPRLQWQNGAYAGTFFDFNPGENITLGRDESQCQIILPVTEDKVSRVHCSVGFDANTNAYTVVDLGSKNGTMLADGTRLRPHVPTVVQRNNVILLGDDKNTFRLV